ncbi:MAG: hypothetical protein NC548_27115 [Lachnospiraceae bacterium]|nr:hypothetical protein [Lachnospiraceae bacterium]
MTESQINEAYERMCSDRWEELGEEEPAEPYDAMAVAEAQWEAWNER